MSDIFNRQRSGKEIDQTSHGNVSPSASFDMIKELSRRASEQQRSQPPSETSHQGYINPLETFSQGQVRDHVAEQQDQIGFPDIAETTSQVSIATDRSQKRSLEEDQATTSDISHKKVKLNEKVDVEQAEEILKGLEEDIKQIISGYKDIPQEKKAAERKEIEKMYGQWSNFARDLTTIVRRKIARREEYIEDFKELKKDKRILEQTQLALEKEEENPSVSGQAANTNALGTKKALLKENIKRLDTKLQKKDEVAITQRKEDLQMLLERREDQAAILSEAYESFLSSQESQSSPMEEVDPAPHLDPGKDPVTHTDVSTSSKSKGKARASEIGQTEDDFLETEPSRHPADQVYRTPGADQSSKATSTRDITSEFQIDEAARHHAKTAFETNDCTPETIKFLADWFLIPTQGPWVELPQKITEAQYEYIKTEFNRRRQDGKITSTEQTRSRNRAMKHIAYN